METSRIAVCVTCVGPYTRPLWDISLPFDPEKIRSSQVLVDFEPFGAVEAAITKGGIRKGKMAIAVDEIPLVWSGKRPVDVIEFGIGKEIVVHELLRQVCAGCKCLFCPPLAAINYVLAAKDRVLEHPLATIFHTEFESRLCRQVISGSGGLLEIETDFLPMDYVFPADVNFLAVGRERRPK